MTEHVKSSASKKPAPTLYFIIAVKLIKGVALILLALGVLSVANKDLPDMFNQFLQWVHLDPERSFFTAIADWLNTVTPTNMRAVALGMFLCGLFLLVEGLGLAFRAKWAIWLAIGESAFFIPIEVFELVRRRSESAGSIRPMLAHPKIGLAIVLALNVLIVWYLFKNRQRLFRHHG
jgi:uncharacterized membrane protein (DUF2068 family)